MKKSRSIAIAVRRISKTAITCTKHIVFLFGVLIVFLATCAQERIGYTQTVSADKPVEQVRKNIQVLKGLPDSQLFPVMNAVGDALGVKCDYCHVKRGEKYYNGDWVYASDEKPQKLRGREMMKMVLEINKTNFGGNQKVTCYTCHRGGQSVARIVPLPPLDLVALGNTEAKPALPTAEQILNKYVAAVGQPAALAKLKTTVLKGKIERSAGRPSDSVEITLKGADKYLVKLTTPQGVRTQVINGTTGWVKINDDAKELPPTAVAEAKRSLILYAAVKVAEQPAQMTVLGMENVGDRETYVLTLTVDAKTTKKFFFDARSGLLLRELTITETILSPLQEQTDFEDYRDVDGVKLPFTIRTSELAAFATATRKFSEIRHNAAVDDALFQFPKKPE